MTTTTYTGYNLPADIDVDADGNLPVALPLYGWNLYAVGRPGRLGVQPKPGSRALVLLDGTRERAAWIVAGEHHDPEYGPVTHWTYEDDPSHWENWRWLVEHGRVLRVDAVER